MRAKNKIRLLVALVILPTMVADYFISRHMIEEQIRSGLVQDAEDVRAILMATRRVYHQQFLNSGLPLNEKTIGFLPAHALSRISADFPNWSKTGLYFNNVSDNPRNPVNMADALELESMAYFRANPGTEQRVVQIRGSKGEPLLHFTSPIWVEPYCLNCHGDRNQAPATVAGLYDKAYSYQVGDLRGVMSIKLPITQRYEREMATWRQGFTIRLGAYAALLYFLGILMNQMLTRRLRQINRGISAIREGDYTAHVAMAGSDELAELSKTFDEMTATIRQRDEALRLAQAAQRQELEFINAIFDTANTLIVVLDSQGRIQRINDAGKILVGYQSAEINGQYFWDVFLLEPEREAVKAVFHHIRAGDVIARYENHWRCKDGSARLLDWSNSILTNAQGDVEYIISVGVDMTERKLLEDQVRKLAFNDPLTNLPNRRLLQDRLRQAIAANQRTGQYGAVMFLDLDNFKSLNDTQGHNVGDLLLLEVAHRLKSCVRQMDTVARFGGDEFVVMLPELQLDSSESLALARMVAEKIRASLAEPYRLTVEGDGVKTTTLEHQCTASIGLVVFGAYPEIQLEDILKWADTAMYKVKQSGRNAVYIHRLE